MKKSILFIAVSLLISASVANAQSLTGYKFCINPGHGGHDSNDRFIAETGFWESEGNLTKGLYLKNILESLGATVIMSRTQNRTEDDLPLSQIAEIANSNNVDYFHSIHSNAFNNASNYTLILYRGYDQTPTYPQSKEMGAILANKIRAVNRTTAEHNRGDFSFYGNTSGLGVLRPLSMPGTLSEGSFHDYYPESWRLKNDSYLKHEAWAIARAFLQYFNKPGFTDGIIAGILRDESEFVPSFYNPTSGTKDNHKPLNKIKVRLEPGARIFNGDDFNNGFYFFDDLVPGNYKVILEADKFIKDSANVIVVANQSTFYDKIMELQPILDPPFIVNYNPTDSLNEISNITPIVIDFNIRMNFEATQNAFSISPSASGSFKWENDFKRLIFTPSRGYTPGAKNIVRISNSAKTYWGVNLQQTKTFSFITRSKLNLISTYPKSGAKDISTTVVVNVKFDKGIDGTSLGSKISFTDNVGNTIGVNVNQSRYSIGIIEFEPKTPLNNNSIYKLTLREGITDIEYVPLKETFVIEFKTDSTYTFDGYVLDPFEQDYTWNSPASSPNTIGINSSITRFDIMTEKFKSGERSGRLEYQFTGTNGNIEVVRSSPINLGDPSSSFFGMWVFGDKSMNILEYKFTRQITGEHKVKVDTINWSGWKLKKIPFSQILGTGTIQFKSINIVQTNIGSKTGKLFFDELTSNIVTDVSEDYDFPVSYKLEQNYPNPFNPSTTIRFSIPKIDGNKSTQKVRLKIFDLLGKEVATLIDEEKSPGSYEVVFNAKGLVSGIYIYVLQVGNSFSTKQFIDSKKFILLK